MSLKLSSVLFVGLGGAGQRHLRILRGLLPQARFMAFRKTNATPLLNPDFTVSLNHNLEEIYDVELIENLDAGLSENPDLVVISTPSSKHLEPMMAAARVGVNIFVEKPWSNDLKGFGEFRTLVEANGSAMRISFQRRYHPMMARIFSIVKSGELGQIISANFGVGSFVPSWHPYEDWQKLYAVKPELGGGVLLTEIHELDLAYWFFGLPKRIFCTGGNFGPEVLPVEDTAQITLDYNSFSVQISLCFMQQKNRRTLEISGTLGHIAWDAEGNKLEYTNYKKESCDKYTDEEFLNDTMFKFQALDLLADLSPIRNDSHMKAAWVSQAIAACAKKSMLEGRLVTFPTIFSEQIK